MRKTKLIYTAIFIVLVAAFTVFIYQQTSLKNNKINSPGFTGIIENSVDLKGPISMNGNIGFPETVDQIMEREWQQAPIEGIIDNEEKEGEHRLPDRRNLPQNPDSKNEATFPYGQQNKHENNNPLDNPQTVSTSWTGATVLGVNPTNALPADNQGAVGPTQYIVAVNGRIVSFDKTTGTADGVMNFTTNTFFNSVRNGSGTSDPRIRYDRTTQKWFVVIINVSSPNRILFAVSNTSTISGSTTWLFYYIDASGRFYDYPTLGIDNNALYIGTNDFNTGLTTFLGCSGYVVNKANLIAGTLTSSYFLLVPTSGSDGPYTPQGVDNFDASATEGYFIGVSNLVFGKLVMIRVSNPGTSPSVSSNIDITVNSTTYPELVRHLGAASNRRLDCLDDRLFAACIRNNRLWTAHNIEVNSSGVASSSGSRNGSRWYELTNLTGTPTVNQSGTIYDPAASNPLSYWIPTVMVSGQGHAAFIYSSAGIVNYANVSTSGRLSGDALGTTQAVTNVTSSSTAYNIQAVDGQRWGDYSYVSLDPNDDMTMWGVMAFCDATNSYGVRVTKLLAPPPPALTSASPNSLTPGQSSVNVIVTGTPTTGQGFYDPGAGFTNRISASINGGVTVNSITYNSATQVTLNVSTVGATTGSKTVTITNPDGQFVTSSLIFDVPLPVAMSSFNYSIEKRNVKLKWTTIEEVNNKGFDVERQSISANGESIGWNKIGFVSGKENSQSPQSYSFDDLNLTSGRYNYRLKQIDLNGNYEYHNLPTEVLVGKPNAAELLQNYPNPFNPLTKIDYGIPVDGKVSLIVYDITGKVVAELVNENKTAGYYSVEFNASRLASGVYFYKITSPEFTQVKKMLVVK